MINYISIGAISISIRVSIRVISISIGAILAREFFLQFSEGP